jgi:hypothetical protein
MCSRRRNRHFPVPNIACNGLRRAGEGITMTAAACLMVGEQFAAPHDRCDLARNRAHGFAFTEPIGRAAADLATVQTVGSKPQPISAQLQHGFIGQ